ncbi:carboxylate--amine ligase [Natrinema sp. 1APR25-10V2]|uniref:carboxylate--amine ligase n=1 Tax=Natrinema sp. 1APR25-10V2 TaxID=2951081 RepID=UPI002876F1E0|nr:carboxylate--amine ligase [Natrinema sp. 1APR25-10V2]MDS0475662.1 carboxylate--amine ligase [Natrinema sp. 1APR25-10V2]
MCPSTADAEAVVVPAVPVPSSDSCVRSLADAGVHTIVIAADRTAKTFSSNSCDEAVVVPDPETDLERYADALLALARRPDVRTIIPCREADIHVLAQYREAFADHIATPWPAVETLERVTDRVRLADAAEAAGVAVPQTEPLAAATPRDEPAIVKSRYNLVTDELADGEVTGDVARPKTVEHLPPGADPDTEALRDAFGHEPIVQEFVPIDDEYMVGALYDHGEPVATFQHEQRRAPSYTGGGGVYRRSVAEPELEAAAHDLLGELEWHGLACIEYMRHPETGEFYLTEINPRMWTSLAANVQMGADFPRYYWRLATGRADEIDSDYDTGIGCHYLKGELTYLLSLFTDESQVVDRPSIRRAVRDVVGSCHREPRFDILRRDDVWPFLQDLLREVDRRMPAGIDVAAHGHLLGRDEPPVHWRDATPDAPPSRHASSPTAGERSVRNAPTD